MALKQLMWGENDSRLCPECGKKLKFVDGGAVRVVNGKLDMDNAKPKYECHNCGVYYREVMNTGYYDVFNLTEEEKKQTGGIREMTPGEGEISQLHLFCPHCGKLLVPRLEGRIARLNAPDELKADYQCDSCGVTFHETIAYGTHHMMTWYVLENRDIKPVKTIEADESKNVVNNAVKEKEKAAKPKKKLKATGDLPPMILKKDATGHCECPRCGGMMDYIEGQPVRIVNGRPTFEDQLDHFNCPDCQSTFRRIVGTDYFQFSET